MKRIPNLGVSVGFLILSCICAFAQQNPPVENCGGGSYGPINPVVNPQINVEPAFALVEPATPGQSVTVPFYINLTAGLGWEAEYDGCGDLIGIAWPCLWEPQVIGCSWSVVLEGNIVSAGSSSSPSIPFPVSFVPEQSGVGTITFWGSGAATSTISNWLDGACASIPFAVLGPMRLGNWEFNNPNLVGDEGEVPIAINNVGYVINWNYGAVQMNGGSNPSVLGYAAYQPDDMPNVTLNSGTVRFWYAPNWTSGTGPGNTATLFEMDGNGRPEWSLSVDSRGNQLTLTAPGTSLTHNITWTANQWYQIVVTYCKSGVAIYVNGSPLGSSVNGETYAPGVLSDFLIGNGMDSYSPAPGLYDELETFNYPLASSDILANYQQVSSLDTDGAPISNLQQIADGLDPYDPFDYNGGAVPAGAIPDPNDPNRWDPGDPTETCGPVITLVQPISATLIP